MNEINLINKITNILKSKYIGDDCAYLEDLGIVITQDSLVEDVHFKINLISPYQLGYKSIMVNLSDVASSGACPKYVTIALSIPSNINEDYIEEFYKGAKTACDKHNVHIVGGDLTGGEKLFISVTAIGSVIGRKISSRSNAKVGQKVVVIGEHGSSAGGLRFLLEGKSDKDLINSHLMPEAKVDTAKQISMNIKEDYAMMDTSDGLFDALGKIAQMSEVTLEIDFNKIEFNSKLKVYFNDYKDLIFYGGEDYGIVATLPEDMNIGTKIGRVVPQEDCLIKLLDNGIITKYSNIQERCFQHFD